MRCSVQMVVRIGFAATLASSAVAENSDQAVCNASFVQNAETVSMQGSTITMENVSPMVTFFCDRPVRFAGHLSVDGFLDVVSEGDESFKSDPPNAVVSIIADGEQPVDVVVELTSRPVSENGNLVYRDVKIIRGQIPQVSGPGSMFIDHFGRPMSPGSVAGVHRRYERRRVRSCEEGRIEDARGVCSCGPGLVCN